MDNRFFVDNKLSG